MKPTCALVALWLCYGAAPAFGQAAADASVSSRQQVLDEIVDAGVKGAQQGVPFRTRMGTGGRGQIVAYLIAAHSEREGYRTLLDALEARAQKQVGSVPSSKGTTSLAIKGLAPKILGLAVESGAITQEANGTTLTFRATPLGVAKALQAQGLVDMRDDYARSALQRYLAGVSVAASFDTSKGPSAGTLTADKRQLTGWSIRTEIRNQRDPAAPRNAQVWNRILRGPGETAYIAAREAIDQELGHWADYLSWEKRLKDDTDRLVDGPLAGDHDVKAAGARFRALLQAALPKLEKLPSMPAPALEALDAYVGQLTKLQQEIDSVYAFIAKGDLLTFDWSTTRDPALPDLYAATGIWEHALGSARKTDFTVNAAANFYRTQPAPPAHQFKSFDLSAQIDHPLGRAIVVLSKATVTIAARFSHLPNDTVAGSPIPQTTASGSSSMASPAPKGNIGVFQMKLTVPVANSGIKIPLSITASNRTELIKEKDVRASIGVTFDLDAFVGGLLTRR